MARNSFSTGRSNGGRPNRQADLVFSTQLLAQELFLVPEFGRQIRAAVFHLLHRANFDFCTSVEGSPLEPLDGFLDRLYAPDPIARDQFFGFGKGSVFDEMVFAGEPHAFTLGAGPQPVGRQQQSGLGQFFVVLAHFAEQFRARKRSGLGFLACLHYDHDSHCFSPSLNLILPIPLLLVCRTGTRPIDSLGFYEGKPLISSTGRTSTVPQRPAGILPAMSRASSRLAAFTRKKPPTGSRVSANGPSVIICLP